MLKKLEDKWGEFFKKVDKAKIEYVKRRCIICAHKDLNHYSECNHIEIDFNLMSNSVNRRLKKETKEIVLNHLDIN